MNELLFFVHIFLLIASVLIAYRIGRSTLIALMACQILIANLFVTKQMTCFGLHVTCSDVYTIGALLTLNLLQETYGKKAAKQTVHTVFFLLLFFIGMAYLHLKYIPSPFDTMQNSFQQILSLQPRIIIASLVVGFCCQRLDILFYQALKKKFSAHAFVFRFGVSSLLSQLIDTTAFSFLALYGIVHSMGGIIFMSYAIKVLVILTMAPFIALSKRWLRDPIYL